MAGIPFYKVSDMNLSENNTVMNVSSNYVTDDQISRNKWKPIDGNTIIFAKVGAAVFLERKRQTRCKFLIDNNMMSYKPNSIQDHDYIYYTFQNLNLSHYAQIGSLPSLNAGELKNVNIVLPDQNEQSKVSQLFLNLDRTITLHEEQHRQLEQLKKALLQKMFADKGYPVLRFKGFTDEWEQRKSKELFINISDKHHPELSVLSATQDNGMVYRQDLDIDIKYDEESLDNYKKVSPSDFVISLRSFQGGFEMSDKLGITSPAYTIFNFKNPNNQYPVFWKFLFKRYDFIESLKRVTFGIRDGKAISFKQFGDTKPSFPQLKEQQLIADTLSKFDKTITLHDKKIQYLKQLKRGLLQKMFV